MASLTGSTPLMGRPWPSPSPSNPADHGSAFGTLRLFIIHPCSLGARARPPRFYRPSLDLYGPPAFCQSREQSTNSAQLRLYGGMPVENLGITGRKGPLHQIPRPAVGLVDGREKSVRDTDEKKILQRLYQYHGIAVDLLHDWTALVHSYRVSGDVEVRQFPLRDYSYLPRVSMVCTALEGHVSRLLHLQRPADSDGRCKHCP
jgi:hypothetical protein